MAFEARGYLQQVSAATAGNEQGRRAKQLLMERLLLLKGFESRLMEHCMGLRRSRGFCLCGLQVELPTLFESSMIGLGNA